ncbi:hypothetical protein [Rhizobium sp. FY34]|uniref:hypothetical protein n=1 Tax=Rhizobium sp. FY34 TaxID=2562309 RepID=UPI001484EF72|nr:hypothetical protein [Rhizobium sp. FY34]
MRLIRTAVTVLACLFILVGLIWIGQGTGYFPYPASSFMINQTPWIAYGALLAAVGAGLLLALRRYRR